MNSLIVATYIFTNCRFRRRIAYSEHMQFANYSIANVRNGTATSRLSKCCNRRFIRRLDKKKEAKAIDKLRIDR